MSTLLKELIIPDNSAFRHGEDPIDHAAKNVGSFWLAHMASRLKDNQSIVTFTDVGESLIDAEFQRPIYRGLQVHGKIQTVHEETYRLAKEYIEDQYQTGNYKDVWNRIVELNEETNVNKQHILAAFRKQ